MGLYTEGIYEGDTIIRTCTTSLTAGDLGKAVAMNATDEIGFGSDGDVLIGKLLEVLFLQSGTVVSADKARVQIRGVLSFTMSDTSVLGYQVVVDGAGLVKEVAAEASQLTGGHKGRGVIVMTAALGCTLIL